MPPSYSRGTRSPIRNALKIAAITVLALTVVTPALLYEIKAETGATQSEILFQTVWGDSSGSGQAVALDSLGNSYVAGNTYYAVPEGAYIASAVFLLKFDPMGSLMWQRLWSNNVTAGSNGGDYPSDIAVDSLGNIYVTGWTCSSPGPIANNVFLLKFNSSGNLAWQRTYDSGGNDEGHGVVVDDSDNIYVTGAIGCFGSGSWDVLLLKVDPSGGLLWQKTYGGASSDRGSELTVDPSGYIYVTGSTSSFSSGMDEVLLLKIGTSGELLWQRTWGPPKGLGFAFGNAVAVDSFGNAYVTGNFDNPAAYDVLLLKFNSSGSLVWQRIWNGGDWDYAEDIAVDPSGSIYVGGYVMGFDVLLLRFDSSGNRIGQVTWGKHVPGGSAKCFGVAVDSSGNPLLTGVVEMDPPYTFVYPNGTISESPFGPNVPNFALNTPTFPLSSYSGVVQTPYAEETAGKTGTFLVKLGPLGYTEDYIESTAQVFGLPPIAAYGIASGVPLLAVVLTAILLKRKRRPPIGTRAGEENAMTVQSAMPVAQVQRNIVGFSLSLIAGVIITIGGLILLLQPYMFLVNPTYGTMGTVGFMCGIIVTGGAALIRMPGKQKVGSILVILFSIISFYGLGGLFFGFILGIAGGVLGLAKPGKVGPGFVISIAGCSLSLFIAVILLLSAITYGPSGSWGGNFFAPETLINPLIPLGVSNPVALSAIATISGVVALIGAILIYMPGKEAVGSILVVAFLLVSFIALGSPLGLPNIVGIIGGIIGTAKLPKRAVSGIGLASSFIGGILITIDGLWWFFLRDMYIPFSFALGSVALTSGIGVFIGSILGYALRKPRVGGILVIAFSLIGTISSHGGFLVNISLFLGIIGGIIGLTKK